MYWTDDSLKSRIAGILTHGALRAANLQNYHIDVAEAANSSVSSVRNWREGKVAPDATAILNLIDNLEGFEGELRGEMTSKVAALQLELAELKSACRDLGNGGGPRALPMKGKIS